MKLSNSDKLKITFYSAAFIFGVSLTTYGSCNLSSELNTNKGNIESETNNYIYYGKGEHIVKKTYDTKRRKVIDEYGNSRETQMLPSDAYVAPDGYMLVYDEIVYNESNVTYTYINTVPVSVKNVDDFGVVTEIEEKIYKKSN